LDPSVQSNLEQVEKVLKSFTEGPGPGTRCMKNYKIILASSKEDYYRANADNELTCESFDKSELIQNYSMPTSSFIQELNKENYTYTKKSVECDCSNGFPKCPESAGGDIYQRNIRKLKTKDILHDLSGRNMSDWLIKTELNPREFRKRFGGFQFLNPFFNSTTDNLFINLGTNFRKLLNSLQKLEKNNLNSSNLTNNLVIIEQILTSIESNNSNMSQADRNFLLANQNIKIWYNNKGYDAIVSYLNVINNALLRSKLSEGEDPSEHGIVLFNHPMPLTQTQFLSELDRRLSIDLFVAICMIFALSFIPASFLVFLLEERQNNSKQLQFVSGVKPYIYWLSNFVWDLVNYIVPCILCILIFLIFDVKTYISTENFPCLVAVMLLYGWACIPLMYPLNFLFKAPSTAFVVSSSMNVFIGIISTMTTTVIDQLGDKEPDLLEVNKVLKPLFTILFPHFCLGQGFLTMSILYNTAEAKRSFGYTVNYSPFDFDNVGKNLVALSLQGGLYFLLNLLIQYEFFIHFKPKRVGDKFLDVKDKKKIEKKNDDNGLDDDSLLDEDVVHEKKRILENEFKKRLNNNMFKKNRFKIFNKKTNVENSDKKKIEEEEENDYAKVSNDDYIRLVNLTKVYKKFDKYRFKRHRAVDDLCLGINKGECFGLIGMKNISK
jgi:ATP-binding cassette subfamily A (ABC1) protein 1